MAHSMKFLQRICTLAVYVTVVLHSFPVGVLGSDGNPSSSDSSNSDKANPSKPDNQLTVVEAMKEAAKWEAKEKALGKALGAALRVKIVAALERALMNQP
eukprot:560917_1